MKKVLLERLPDNIPAELKRLVENKNVYNSSCSEEARVYYVDAGGGYYIKTASAGALLDEAQMTRFYHSIGLGVEVIDYMTSDRDWFITRAARGEDCTHRMYLQDPKRLCSILGEGLRMLHETSFDHCPIQDRMITYKNTVERNHISGMFDKDLFDGTEYSFERCEEAYSVYSEGAERLTSRVLLHGDYCLPNIVLDDWRISAFIDVGNGGVGDRHIDLFWGVWTLWFNLKTNEYADRFLDAYGRDEINTELLRVVAAAETFG